MSLHDQYKNLFEGALIAVADSLQTHMLSLIAGMNHVDRVSVRAKTVSRFTAKAAKKNPDGSPKYDNPLHQIQDQIGGRIIVFYLQDVDTMKKEILTYFTPIEIVSKAPDRDSEFGYFGEHFILKIPSDVIPDDYPSFAPEFFELQIKTLFQHAWSEAHHDLGYKSSRPLTALERRQSAFSAAQAWGADHVFQDLVKSLSDTFD